MAEWMLVVRVRVVVLVAEIVFGLVLALVGLEVLG